MGKESIFYCFRYFDVRKQDQLFDSSSKNLMQRLIEECKKHKIEIHINQNKRSGLLYVRDLGEDLVLLKQYKETQVTVQKFNSSEEDIIPVEDDSLPFIYVIVSLGVDQTISYQKKTTVYSTPSAARNAFLRIVKTYFDDPNIALYVDEIGHRARFWKVVQEAERIYSLKLKLRSPNLFGGTREVNELLSSIKEENNNDFLLIEFNNESGRLRIRQEEYEDVLKYIDGGGGSWELSYEKMGDRTRERATSKTGVASFEIARLDDKPKLLDEGNGIHEKIKAIDESFEELKRNLNNAQDSRELPSNE